jgi:hypothetical protein
VETELAKLRKTAREERRDSSGKIRGSEIIVGR